jgi:hypothetical protein
VSPQVDTTLVKAIARAFRWQKMLETGQYGTIKEITKAEKINPSYFSRVLRLTLLAPDIVEAAIGGRLAPDVTLAVLAKPFARVWRDQKFANSDRLDASP